MDATTKPREYPKLARSFASGLDSLLAQTRGPNSLTLGERREAVGVEEGRLVVACVLYTIREEYEKTRTATRTVEHNTGELRDGDSVVSVCAIRTPSTRASTSRLVPPGEINFTKFPATQNAGCWVAVAF